MNNKKSLPFNNPWLLMVDSVGKNAVMDNVNTQVINPIAAWLKPILPPAMLQTGRKLTASKAEVTALPMPSGTVPKTALSSPCALQQYHQLAEEVNATLARVNVRTQRSGVSLMPPDARGDAVSIALRAAQKHRRR